MEIYNATLSKADIGWEDHGMFCPFLTAEYDRGTQGMFAYRFDEYDKDSDKCIGQGKAIDFMMVIMKTLEVNYWSEMGGQLVRIKVEGGMIVAIGHIMKDQWFAPQDVGYGK